MEKIKKILKFSASWCGPCKQLANTLKSMDESIRNIITEYDIEENEELCEKYSIKSIPTLIFLGDNDEVLHKINGNISKQVIEEDIDKIEKEA